MTISLPRDDNPSLKISLSSDTDRSSSGRHVEHYRTIRSRTRASHDCPPDCLPRVKPFEQGPVDPRGCAAHILRPFAAVLLATVESAGEGLAEITKLAGHQRPGIIFSRPNDRVAAMQSVAMRGHLAPAAESPGQY